MLDEAKCVAECSAGPDVAGSVGMWPRMAHIAKECVLSCAMGDLPIQFDQNPDSRKEVTRRREDRPGGAGITFNLSKCVADEETASMLRGRTRLTPGVNDRHTCAYEIESR